MPKHPLLPDTYTEPALHSAILFALSPYAIEGQENASNPKLRWSLNKAWQEAKALLDGGIAKHTLTSDSDSTNGEITADTDREVEEINTILAGIIAYQILEPDSGMSLHRVDYRKGGEVALVLPGAAVEKINELFPHLKFSNGNRLTHISWWQRFFTRKKRNLQ